MALHALHLDWRPFTAAGLWLVSLVAALDMSEGRIAGYTAVLGGFGAACVLVWSQIDKARQKSHQEWDVINKDSLSANLAKVMAELTEAESDRKKIRERLHQIRDEAQKDRMEATHLRDQVSQLTDRLVEATQEIVNLRRQTAAQPEKTATAVMAAIGQSQAEMPVVPPAPAPKPEARP